MILIIYTDSIIFVLGGAVLSQGYGNDKSRGTCTKAVILCLACYMTTKVGGPHSQSSDLSLTSVGGRYQALKTDRG